MTSEQRYDHEHGIFILGDHERAVTFWPATRSIGVHSAQPRPDLPPFADECEYLDGAAGYCDGSFTYGHGLADRWEQSGRDDQLVWDALGEWFASWFPAPEVA